MKVSAVLIIKISIDRASSTEEIRQQLLKAADHLAAYGMLNKNSQVVDSCESVVYVAEEKLG